jgi:hypothetical protein
MADRGTVLLERLAATKARPSDGQPLVCGRVAAGGLVHLFKVITSRSRDVPRYGSYPGFNPMVELSMTFHTQIVGSNGQRQAMFIERPPGLAEVCPIELHVRAA